MSKRFIKHTAFHCIIVKDVVLSDKKTFSFIGYIIRDTNQTILRILTNRRYSTSIVYQVYNISSSNYDAVNNLQPVWYAFLKLENYNHRI